MTSISDVHNQDISLCGTGCCGCSSAWSATCYNNVPVCKACTGTPPPQISNSTCSNGRWVIQGSYTGSLLINGSVILVGDYYLPASKSLIFVGFKSQLNVTGKVTLREGVTMVLSDAEINTLRPLGYLRYQVTYMTAGVAQSALGSSGGKGAVVYAHSRRKCLRPYVYVSGDSKTFTASFRYSTACNTWWIILLCCSPSILGFFGGIIAAVL